MTLPEHFHSPMKMPATAERALQRATGRTLTSFASLRTALREHVETERKESSLEEIELELRAIVARVRHEMGGVPVDAGWQDNLSEHVKQWTETFFHAPRSSV